MNERIAMMRERSMINLPRPDPHAEELRKESSALTAGEPPVIREAKAIAYFYRNRIEERYRRNCINLAL